MKALVCIKPGQFEYTEMPDPELKAGHAIIRIRNIGICGTDLHAYEGTQPFFNYPRILGHELSGEIVDLEGASDFVRGETVCFLPYLNCGTCLSCRIGKTNSCVNLQVCGVHIDGGMSDYYSIPSRLLVHGLGLSLAELALAEPLAIGAHGISRAAIQPEEFVLVMGAGPIGLAALEFARLKQAKRIVMDIHQQRLDFCREKMQVEHTISASDHSIREQLLEITGGDLPSVVIDASGNRNAILGGLNWLAHGGRYVLIGLQKGDLVFSHPEFHRKETTLMSSRNATRSDFEWVTQSMSRKQINPLSMITHRVKFHELAAQFPQWLNGGNGVIKALVEND